jgi:formylglycine-generating enzyme
MAGLPQRVVSAQSSDPKSAVVRIVPGDANKIPGTGFIVKLDQHAAYILTAAHVVEGGAAPKVEFFTQPNSLVSARIAEGAEWGDAKGLAMLIVDAPLPTGLTVLPIDAVAKLKGGEAITVIGHPASGGNWSISTGEINSRRGKVLYFSAPVDKGSSGGPLLHEGKVVGIVTNKGAAFGEAVEALTILSFFGNDMDTSTSGSPTPAEGATGPSKPWRDCEDPACPWLVTLPPGRFMMGEHTHQGRTQPSASPQHEVNIAYPLAMMETEVTRGQFRAFVDATKHSTERGCEYGYGPTGSRVENQQFDWRNPGFSQTDDHPVVCVNWYDTQEYAKWLSAKTGKRYRLPSESEWEYAARAGSTTVYGFGESFESLCAVANVFDQTAISVFGEKDRNGEPREFANCADGHVYTAVSRTFKPNPWGLYGMYGNVSEWVQDCIVDFNYKRTPVDGSSVDGPACVDANYWVSRGGEWRTGPFFVRAANRDYLDRSGRTPGQGMRLVRVLP